MTVRHLRVAVCLLVLAGVSRWTAGAAKPDPYLLKIAKNGSVLHSPSLRAIFWGSEWNDSAFAGDIVSGLDALLVGFSGSDYAATLTEYYDRTGPITMYATYQGYTIDSSPAPVPGGLTPSVAIAKVCATTNNNPEASGVYFVFPSTTKAPGSPGSACGFHASGSCSNGKLVQVIGVPHTTGTVESGCSGTQDSITGHSLALAQMANVSMHELAETITDPRGTGWRDSYGAETGNKCILTFPPDIASYPVFSNGSVWKLQGVWSNAAFLAGTGEANNSGQKACVW